MRPGELQGLLRHRPSTPLRLTTSGGDDVKIRHPELAFVTQSCVVVGVVKPGSDVVEYTKRYNLLHIVTIETVNDQTALSG